MDETSEVTEPRGDADKCMHRLARGHIDGCGAHVKAGVGQHLSRRIGVRLVKIGKHDMLACADPPGNRLANLSSSNHNSDVAHEYRVSCRPALASRTVRGCVFRPVTEPTIRRPYRSYLAWW